MEEDQVDSLKIDESLKVGFFYTSQSKIYRALKNNKNLIRIQINNEELDWNELKKEINLSHFSIIFLDGGNPPSIQGLDLLGDEVADYVDNGGVVCTLGASNAKDAYYTIKGRWKREKYQAVGSKQKNFFF